jgi:hypothetical protein
MQAPSAVSSVTVPDLFSFVSFEKVLLVGFSLLFILWALHALVASYHLLRYGHRSTVTIPAIGLYVFVSAALATFALTALAL